MSWTTTIPTKEGWYWWRDKQPKNGIQFPYVVKIVSIHGTLYVEDIGHGCFLRENASGEWQGPILPEEQP